MVDLIIPKVCFNTYFYLS